MANRIRIAHTVKSGHVPLLHQGAPLIDGAAELLPFLRRNLPPSWPPVLAEPKLVGEHLDWWGEGLGNAVALDSLPKHEQARLQAVLDERLAAIRALADRTAVTDPAMAERLRAAVQYPGSGSVYVVAGEPVVTFWGHGGQAPPPPVIAAPPVVAAAPVAGGCAGRSALLAALAALLLLALALALAWWLKWWPFGTDDLLSRLRQAEDRGSALESEARDLEKRLQEALDRCRVPAPPKPPEPTPQPTPQPPKPPEPPKAVPPRHVEPAKPVSPPQRQSMPAPQQPSEQQAKVPPPNCPGPRKPWEAPEVVFALDASGSMRYPIDMSPADEQRIVQGVRRRDRAAMAEAERVMRTPVGSRRIDHAKMALNSAVDDLPADVDAGLITFGNCSGTDNFQFFKVGERGRMHTVVNGIEPREGTPLARGIERAANMIKADDPTKPGIVVVLSDGEDSCGGDPCAMARSLKRRKPGLVINVVMLSPDDRAACMASETGGKIFRSYTPDTIQQTVKNAAGQQPDSACKEGGK